MFLFLANILLHVNCTHISVVLITLKIIILSINLNIGSGRLIIGNHNKKKY